MKRLHRPDLFGWSEFNTDRNLDFHSVLWVRDGGNVAIDPLPLSEHDRAHLQELGSVATVVITNSDHYRDAAKLAAETGATIVGPAAERDGTMACTEWLADGDEVVPGLRVVALDGSKTPGELALVLEETTLITGDLVRAHEGGRLCMLPPAKLKDATLALASVRRLSALTDIETVLPGDGWPIFRHGREALLELAYPAGQASASKGPPVIRFVGRSESGKTTVVSKLIEHWRGAGLRVGAIKHASKSFQIDRPGKDSHRFQVAGAEAVALASPDSWAVIGSSAVASGILELVDRLPAGLDVILVEGFKGDGGMAVEVHRGSEPLLSSERELPGRIAVVTDKPGTHDSNVPELDSANTTRIAEFLEGAAGFGQRLGDGDAA